MDSNSILAETEHGTYYTGPLEPAQRAMRDEYGDDLYVRRGLVPGESWVVAECRGATPDGPSASDALDAANQWGMGETEEEAWRYLIGSDFGPLDATYEDEGYEAHQRRMLGLDES